MQGPSLAGVGIAAETLGGRGSPEDAAALRGGSAGGGGGLRRRYADCLAPTREEVAGARRGLWCTGALWATTKAQKRDPAKISGPCASPSLTSWIAHPRGLLRGGDDANRAQHDDVDGRQRTAFSTIERRVPPPVGRCQEST